MTDYPDLKIVTSGSDFCDYFVAQKNYISSLSGETRELAEIDYEQNRRKALAEYQLYNEIRYLQKSRPNNWSLLCVFDFAEKVLLAKMERHQVICTLQLA